MVDTDRRYEQPGLELAHTEYQPRCLPQVLPRPGEELQSVEVESQEKIGIESDPLPTVLHSEFSTTELPSDSGSSQQKGEPLSVKKRTCSRKLVLIAVASVAIIAIIVGVGLGTTLPRRLNMPATSTENASTTSLISPAEMTGTVTSVAPGLAPTAISWGYPHFEVYVVAPNSSEPSTSSSVWRKYRNSNATQADELLPLDGFELLNGTIDVKVNANMTPSFAVSGRYRKDINSNVTTMVLTSDSYEGHRKSHANDEIWNGWGTFKGLDFRSPPTLVNYANADEITAFVISVAGASSAVYYYQTPGGNGANFPPTAQFIPAGPDLYLWCTPAVVAWNGDWTQWDVFVVAEKDNHLWHISKNPSGWSTYQDLNGFATTPPVVVTRTPGTLDVFVSGGDGGIWHLGFSESQNWSNWTLVSAGIRTQGQPNAISMSADTVDLFAWGEDNSMLRRRYNSIADIWEPADGFFTVTDTKLSGPPSAMSDKTGSISVFAYSDDGKLIWVTLPPGTMSKVEAVVLDSVFPIKWGT